MFRRFQQAVARNEKASNQGLHFLRKSFCLAPLDAMRSAKVPCVVERRTERIARRGEQRLRRRNDRGDAGGRHVNEHVFASESDELEAEAPDDRHARSILRSIPPFDERSRIWETARSRASWPREKSKNDR